MNKPGKVPLGDPWKEIRHIVPSIFQRAVSPFSAPGAQRGTTFLRGGLGALCPSLIQAHWFMQGR